MTAFDSWLSALGQKRFDEVFQREEDYTLTIVFAGEDLTGKTFTGEIKAEPGQTSAALASFTFGTPTLASGDTTVVGTIAQSVVNALPENTDKSEPIELVYDAYMASGGARELVVGGIAKINAGVTQA